MKISIPFIWRHSEHSEPDGEQFIAESHTTAELLRSDGNAEWLVARSRKVEATGKGTLQTYSLRHASRRHLFLEMKNIGAPDENAVGNLRRSQSSAVCSVSGRSSSSFAETCSVDVTSSADRVCHHDVRDVLDPESWSRFIRWNV